MKKTGFFILFLIFSLCFAFNLFAWGGNKKEILKKCEVEAPKMVEFIVKNANREWSDLSEEEKQYVIEFVNKYYSWGSVCKSNYDLPKKIGVITPKFSIGKTDYRKWGKDKLTFVTISRMVGNNLFLPYFFKKVYGDTVEVRIERDLFVDRLKKLEKLSDNENLPKVCFAGFDEGGTLVTIKGNVIFKSRGISFENRIYCPALHLNKEFRLTEEEAKRYGAVEKKLEDKKGHVIIYYSMNDEKIRRAVGFYEFIRRMYLWVEKEFGEKGRGWIHKQI